MAAVPLTAGASAAAQALATTRAGSQLVAVAIARTGTAALVLWPGEAPPVSIDPLDVFSTLPEVDPLDLLDEVPPYEREAYEIQAVLQVVGNELLRLETARQAVALNFLPGSADALLPMFEQLLGLPVNPPGLTLASRQQLVQASMLRLKGQGSGLEWEAAISSLLGGSWSYQESIPPATNALLNPSFERDTVGATPATWTVGGLSLNTASAVAATNYADRGSRSLRVVSTALTPGFATGMAALGPTTIPSRSPGWTARPGQQIAVRMASHINSVSGQFQVGMIIWFYDATGTTLLVLGLGNQNAVTAGSTYQHQALTSAPAQTAFVQFAVEATCTTAGTIDLNFDSVGLYFDPPGGVVPPYGDGDQSGWTWQGTPGNSASIQVPSPPANTVAIKIPQAMAGIAWPFIRDLTPAHLAINEGYSDGFFVDISTIGSNL